MSRPTATNQLSTHGLDLRYGDRVVIGGLDLALPGGAITAIVGPNACGKSTLLRGLTRLLAPSGGSVTLDGADIHRMSARALARRMGLLPQQPVTPDSITVETLVRLGRYPHQRLLSPWSKADQGAVEEALERTGTTALRDQPVDQLSGGQRQRAWIALALAQDTELLLLDEPTTFLDLRHQLDVLDLVAELHAEAGRTVVMVLHDLGQAARYADHLVVLKDGALAAAGAPADVLDAELVRSVFEVDCRVIPDPETGTPLVIPKDRAARHAAAVLA
ncbi:ABC transporter ATP-binding protein [Streptomyces fulvorobeus]|uniref:Cobalamin/Fe3+-siderophore ABC transporter ATP-binding protein n=1 Tax=Streptomyces fulvorobeus TaxID=284028 RepID=A0A7J0C5G6_9ACTN|nr:ABC transporter ATP-binding protein [Streptomyces fulvorobeus]NYE41380.1 iron complex transport system ATP-binding protein [Streptomyces fulvorobeus]GFM97731.1 cobalamin/Fe3+-siderophore ABC transporter ATP-binding protein [Streptomyces fulvorobeus]